MEQHCIPSVSASSWPDGSGGEQALRLTRRMSPTRRSNDGAVQIALTASMRYSNSSPIASLPSKRVRHSLSLPSGVVSLPIRPSWVGLSAIRNAPHCPILAARNKKAQRPDGHLRGRPDLHGLRATRSILHHPLRWPRVLHLCPAGARRSTARMDESANRLAAATREKRCGRANWSSGAEGKARANRRERAAAAVADKPDSGGDAGAQSRWELSQARELDAKKGAGPNPCGQMVSKHA
jgi:hypothetical protein